MHVQGPSPLHVWARRPGHSLASTRLYTPCTPLRAFTRLARLYAPLHALHAGAGGLGRVRDRR